MTLDELNALDMPSASALVDDWWDGYPETPVEQDRWDDLVANSSEADAIEVTRMYRFLQVRGAPGEPAKAPTVWMAMLAHPSWSHWLGLRR